MDNGVLLERGRSEPNSKSGDSLASAACAHDTPDAPSQKARDATIIGSTIEGGRIPANLTPAYKAAEARYRHASDPEDRLEALRAMLRAIPKHKGTEHLQADIKARIKELSDELAGPRKGGARTGPATVVRPEGAGQIALLGPPNTGKSALHARITGSHGEVGEYPFTTQYPMPGMMPVHDVAIQLVDLPPIAEERPVPWISNTLRPADGCLLVVDLSDPDCVERVLALHDLLSERRVELVATWPADGRDVTSGQDVFTIFLPTLLVASKADLLPDPTEELAVLEELTGVTYPYMAISSTTGQGLADLATWVFDHLGVVRVYTKIPGKDPDMDRPYTVQLGSTVGDVATLVHREIAAELAYARVWSIDGFEGRHVGREHLVHDGDIVELHV